ncbi:SDR family NAD(P)-dependent oxidoreductase [Neptuniibacter sp. QD48_11]|uniref:SDR family NAD(P)-dependent oxidoreductase n=1 Tax=unclassified Neptuniibacter TaxID=2630693 RepID=UPI0039F561A2
MKTILIVGSSRGIGEELTKHFSDAGHNVIGVSRSPSKNCEWIRADLSVEEEIKTIAAQLGEQPIDTLIYSSGIWEDEGFTDDFDFRKTKYEETQQIMQVNLVAPIELTKALAPNLARATNPRAIYLGANSGLENIGSEQVAYAASKFGLRGAIQSLRSALKQESIGFTAINPGNVGTEEVLMDIKECRMPDHAPIPISDIITSIEMIMSLSKDVEIGDINLSQKST